MLFKTKNFNNSEIEQFTDLQKTCFKIQSEIASGLKEGDDEKTVAKLMYKKYKESGAGNFFHLPVVLFGERAGLPGDWRISNFFPKKNILKQGDSVILDAAPIFNGYLVDTSTSFCFGKNIYHDAMMTDLIAERQLILDETNQGLSFMQIAQNVQSRASANGYESVHEKHPGEVLGHRAGRWITGNKLSFRQQGFDAPTLLWFKLNSKLANLGFKTLNPLWNRNNDSDHPPTDGLWLVEPHYAKNEIGAKWEEILLIDKGKARWLQDDPPHLTVIST